MSWFEDLMGFPEQGDVRAMITVGGDRMTSRVTGETYGCGHLETPSLSELRQRLRDAGPAPGRATLREAVADVQRLHADPRNAGAVFQAASQFNLLEMASYTVTPEAGVGIYAHDHTQGPACAIACGAGTIYRNYFAPVDGGVGQTADRQIDCLADLGRALTAAAGGAPLWSMRNGYALLHADGRAALGRVLGAADDARRDALRGMLRIGVHRDVEVTVSGAGHRVTQIYASALPVAYGDGHPEAWAPFARLVLEAAYEATLIAAGLEARRTGARTVYLTLLGGGVFGNARPWIFDAITRAVRVAEARGAGPLDAAIVSYGHSQPDVRTLVEAFE